MFGKFLKKIFPFDLKGKKEGKYLVIRIPPKLAEVFSDIAEKHDMTEVELIRRFFKLGLVWVSVEEDPKARFLLEDEEGQKEVVGFFRDSNSTDDST